jgi:hypothetical protein
MNAGEFSESFTTTWERSALIAQMFNTLLVLAIDDARAPRGPAAYEEDRRQYAMSW